MKGPTRFFTRHGLYRNVTDGWITGVCAGIADRLGIKPFWVRIAVALITAIGHFIGPAIVYLLLAFLMKPRDEAGAAAPAGVQTAYRDLTDSVAPAAAAGRRVTELKTRFARLDARLNNLEAAVTSDELSLRRKFRDIGG
jgi:phage shock protein C